MAFTAIRRKQTPVLQNIHALRAVSDLDRSFQSPLSTAIRSFVIERGDALSFARNQGVGGKHKTGLPKFAHKRVSQDIIPSDPAIMS